MLGLLSVDYPEFAYFDNTSGIYTFNESILSTINLHNIHNSINILEEDSNIWPSLPLNELAKRKQRIENERSIYYKILSDRNMARMPKITFKW